MTERILGFIYLILGHVVALVCALGLNEVLKGHNRSDVGVAMYDHEDKAVLVGMICIAAAGVGVTILVSRGPLRGMPVVVWPAGLLLTACAAWAFRVLVAF